MKKSKRILVQVQTVSENGAAWWPQPTGEKTFLFLLRATDDTGYWLPAEYKEGLQVGQLLTLALVDAEENVWKVVK